MNKLTNPVADAPWSREKFEEWARQHQWPLQKDGAGEYINPITAKVWSRLGNTKGDPAGVVWRGEDSSAA